MIHIPIFTGGGGVGKSFLIKTVASWAERTLREPGEDPLKPKILLLAPTGSAASIIGKIHTFGTIISSTNIHVNSRRHNYS